MRENLYGVPPENLKTEENIMKIFLKILGILAISVAVFFTAVYTSAITTTYFISQQKSPPPVVCPIEKKPSYEYLKSITVYLEGEGVGEKTGIFYMLTGKTEDEEVKEWAGTGVIVKIDENYTYILTNAHVAGNDFKTKKIYVKESENLRTQVDILKYARGYDMALLRVAKKYDDKTAVVGFNIVKPQDPVYMVGHYLGIPYIYSTGYMAGYEEDVKDGILLQLPGCYGNSGSGVVNSDGELVALVYAIHPVSFFGVDTAKTIAVDGPNVRAFLLENNIL